MKIAVLQVGYSDAEPVATRIQRIAELVAQQRGHDLVVLPELWAPTAFGCEHWAERAETLTGPTLRALRDAARQARLALHFGSILERGAGGQLWNTAGILTPTGEILASYRKVHRFGFSAGESRLISAGTDTVTAALPQPKGQAVRVGLATCYDLRFPEHFRRMAGVEILVVVAAWPQQRIGHWLTLGQARAIENQAFLVGCNTSGSHAGQVMGGRSQVVGPAGEVLAEAGPDPEVLSVELDLAAQQQLRAEFPVLADRVWL